MAGVTKTLAIIHPVVGVIAIDVVSVGARGGMTNHANGVAGQNQQSPPSEIPTVTASVHVGSALMFNGIPRLAHGIVLLRHPRHGHLHNPLKSLRPMLVSTHQHSILALQGPPSSL
jgi:hypothetical protein